MLEPGKSTLVNFSGESKLHIEKSRVIWVAKHFFLVKDMQEVVLSLMKKNFCTEMWFTFRQTTKNLKNFSLFRYCQFLVLHIHLLWTWVSKNIITRDITQSQAHYIIMLFLCNLSLFLVQCWRWHTYCLLIWLNSVNVVKFVTDTLTLQHTL
jgi:hypothetical protein